MRKIISIVLSFGLLFQQSGLLYAAGEINLANYLSQAKSAIVQPDVFQPARLRYISYDINNNDFKLLLDKGNNVNQRTEELKNLRTLELLNSPNSSIPKLNSATQELFNYFLIGLALPNDTFWVNLRPDAPENIIDPLLEKTDIGKIFLEADLQLKKDTASLTSPQNPEGKAYWDKLYKKAGELFGIENITIPTITRPWIVPNEVIVRETEDSAYIYKATLKVMLEADYLQNQKTEKPKNQKTEEYGFSDPRLKELNEYSSQIIRETIIPKLTKEINSSKRYAKLRQVYYSLVLSRWFKMKYNGKPGQYPELIDRQNLTNLASKQAWDKQTYFRQYQESFAKGEYNLKETVDSAFGQSIRSYISGGIVVGPITEVGVKVTSSPAVTKALTGLVPAPPDPVSVGSPLNAEALEAKLVKLPKTENQLSDLIKIFSEVDKNAQLGPQIAVLIAEMLTENTKNIFPGESPNVYLMRGAVMKSVTTFFSSKKLYNLYSKDRFSIIEVLDKIKEGLLLEKSTNIPGRKISEETKKYINALIDLYIEAVDNAKNDIEKQGEAFAGSPLTLYQFQKLVVATIQIIRNSFSSEATKKRCSEIIDNVNSAENLEGIVKAIDVLLKEGAYFTDGESDEIEKAVLMDLDHWGGISKTLVVMRNSLEATLKKGKASLGSPLTYAEARYILERDTFKIENIIYLSTLQYTDKDVLSNFLSNPSQPDIMSAVYKVYNIGLSNKNIEGLFKVKDSFEADILLSKRDVIVELESDFYSAIPGIFEMSERIPSLSDHKDIGDFLCEVINTLNNMSKNNSLEAFQDSSAYDVHDSKLRELRIRMYRKELARIIYSGVVKFSAQTFQAVENTLMNDFVSQAVVDIKNAVKDAVAESKKSFQEINITSELNSLFARLSDMEEKLSDPSDDAGSPLTAKQEELIRDMRDLLKALGNNLDKDKIISRLSYKISDSVKSIIAEVMEVKKKDVAMDKSINNLTRDSDSLFRLEIIALLERYFGVDFDEEEIEGYSQKTVAEIIEDLCQRIEGVYSAVMSDEDNEEIFSVMEKTGLAGSDMALRYLLKQICRTVVDDLLEKAAIAYVPRDIERDIVNDEIGDAAYKLGQMAIEKGSYRLADACFLIPNIWRNATAGSPLTVEGFAYIIEELSNREESVIDKIKKIIKFGITIKGEESKKQVPDHTRREIDAIFKEANLPVLGIDKTSGIGDILLIIKSALEESNKSLQVVLNSLKYKIITHFTILEEKEQDEIQNVIDGAIKEKNAASGDYVIVQFIYKLNKEHSGNNFSYDNSLISGTLEKTMQINTLLPLFEGYTQQQKSLEETIKDQASIVVGSDNRNDIRFGGLRDREKVKIGVELILRKILEVSQDEVISYESLELAQKVFIIVSQDDKTYHYRQIIGSYIMPVFAEFLEKKSSVFEVKDIQVKIRTALSNYIQMYAFDFLRTFVKQNRDNPYGKFIGKEKFLDALSPVLEQETHEIVLGETDYDIKVLSRIIDELRGLSEDAKLKTVGENVSLIKIVTAGSPLTDRINLAIATFRYNFNESWKSFSALDEIDKVWKKEIQDMVSQFNSEVNKIIDKMMADIIKNKNPLLAVKENISDLNTISKYFHVKMEEVLKHKPEPKPVYLPDKNIFERILTAILPDWRFLSYPDKYMADSRSRMFESYPPLLVRFKKDFAVLLGTLNNINNQVSSAIGLEVIAPVVKRGGIDLTDRMLNIKLERVGSFASSALVLPEIANVEALDLDKEYERIQAMVSSSIRPSDIRILEFAAACYYKGEFDQRLTQVSSCVKAAHLADELLGRDSSDTLRLATMLPDALYGGRI